MKEVMGESFVCWGGAWVGDVSIIIIYDAHSWQVTESRWGALTVSVPFIMCTTIQDRWLRACQLGTCSQKRRDAA